MRRITVLVVASALGWAAMLTGCTKRQNPSTCITGDQKSCACLGGGGGVQICLVDGTYGSCLCPFGTGDMAAPTSPIEDMAPVRAVDMVKLPDMASSVDAGSSTCFGAGPDEDGDGLPNRCDACPADPDPTPVDTDRDGLPDACDPNPATVGNQLLYFEPFDVVNPNWSGDNAGTVSQSYLNLDPGAPGIVFSNNAKDRLPLHVRVQIDISPEGSYTGGGMIDTGLFVGTNSNPRAPGTSGVLCRLNSADNTLDVVPVQNGTLLTGTSAALTINAGTYRMRLTHGGGSWTCDATLNGATTTVMTTQAVKAPLYMSLLVENMFAHFLSVAAESVTPVPFADVQADIDLLTCSLGACHGGTQVPVLKAMATGTDLTNNYNNFITDVNLGAPSQSLVLTKNLPGASHGGGSKFSGTSDPVYKRWLAWIAAGAPF